MADELVFYTHPMSRGRIVRWMLEEVGVPYRTEIVEYATTMKGPEYRALNPMGKVPTLVHNGNVITECAAICAYLADAFPQAGLAPAPSSPARGDYYRWLFFAAGPLEAAATTKGLGFDVPLDKSRMAGWGTMADVVNTLDQLLSKNEYVAGGEFSAADVYLGSHLGWSMMFGTIEKRQSFAEYCGRLAQRPAAKRAKDIDDALTPPKA